VFVHPSAQETQLSREFLRYLDGIMGKTIMNRVAVVKSVASKRGEPEKLADRQSILMIITQKQEK